MYSRITRSSRPGRGPAAAFCMWSPSVRNSVGYSAGSGFCPLMWTHLSGVGCQGPRAGRYVHRGALIWTIVRSGSLGSKRHDRVQLRGATGRQVAGQHDGAHQGQGCKRQRRKVGGLNLEQGASGRAGTRRAPRRDRSRYLSGRARQPRPIISVRILARVAPSAVRMPTSCVRWVTAYDTTP